MDYRVASGIFMVLKKKVTLWCSDGVDTHCFLLCCVSFSFQYILMFACARKCSKVLPSRSVGGTHFFIMHENKIHIGWNGISPTTIQDRQLKTRTGITVLFTFVSFSKNTRDLVQMLWMSFAYFMSLLPYNKVLLWWAEYWNEFYYILVMGRWLPCLLGNSVCCNAIVLLFLCKYLNKEKYHLPSVFCSLATSCIRSRPVTFRSC